MPHLSKFSFFNLLLFISVVCIMFLFMFSSSINLSNVCQESGSSSISFPIQDLEIL